MYKARVFLSKNNLGVLVKIGWNQFIAILFLSDFVFPICHLLLKDFKINHSKRSHFNSNQTGFFYLMDPV